LFGLLENKANLNACQARWNAFLSEFDFDIQHVKGKENHVANALSKKMHRIYELCYNQIECKFMDLFIKTNNLTFTCKLADTEH